jgi:hypothetical protein
LAGSRDLVGQVEEFEEVAQEEQAAVQAAGVLQQTAQDALTLGEHAVEEDQVAEGGQALQGAPAHVGHADAGCQQPDGGCRQLPAELAALVGQPPGLDGGADALEGVHEAGAGPEQAQLGGGFGGSEQPVVVPGAALLLGDRALPAVLAALVMHDNPQHGQPGAEQEGDQPPAIGQQQSGHGDQRDQALRQHAQAVHDGQRAVGGFDARPVQLVVLVGDLEEAEVGAGGLILNEGRYLETDAFR